MNRWSSFETFKTYVSTLSTTVEKGNYFEVFSMYLLKYHPTYNYYVEDICLYKDFPPEEKKAYFLHIQDKGTDLIITRKPKYISVSGGRENKYVAVQCKFLSDEGYVYSDKGLATFLDDATRLQGGVYVSTQEEITDFNGSHNLPQRPIIQIGLPEIRRVEELYPEIMNQILQSTWLHFNAKREDPQKYIGFSNVVLRPYQAECIANSIKHYSTQNKGLLTMATGSGKTICARNIVEINKNVNKAKQRIIWVVPKLSLIEQNLYIFGQEEDTFIINFCSLDENGGGVQITTDFEVLYSLLTSFDKCGDKRLIVNVTYASIQKFLDFFKLLPNYFNFIVWDEAHTLAGTSRMSMWFYKNEFSSSVEKQLFMTATPIMLKNERKTNHKFVSMDNKKLFGEVIFNYSLRNAINDQYLADYNILVPVASTIDIQTMYVYVREHHHEIYDDKDVEEIPDLLKAYWRDLLNAFIIKDSFDRGNRKQLSFSIYLKNARIIMKLVILLYKLKGEEVQCFFVSHQTKKVGDVLRAFEKTDKKAVIFSSRVLITGIDVPNVDSICICDPFQSEVVIKQMIGRGTRKHGNKVLNISLGVLAKEDDDFENSDFSVVRNVLFSLNSTDPSLIEQLQIAENKRLEVFGIKPTFNFVAEDKNNIETVFDIQKRISTWRTQLLTTSDSNPKSMEEKFSDLIVWINAHERVPRLMGPDRRKEIQERGETEEEVEIEAKLFWFMRDRKYQNQSEKIKEMLKTCPYYMKWIEKKETRPVDKYDHFIEWVNKNQRIPRKLNPAQREKLCKEGANMEELKTEQTFRNLMMDHKYDTLNDDIKSRLNNCSIYTEWRKKTTVLRLNMSYDEKFKELVQWIEENQRTPRIIKPAKRLQMIDSGIDAEIVNKEATLGTFMYEPKNKFENQPPEIQAELSKCAIYMKWNKPLSETSIKVREDPNSKVKEMILWINENQRMPRKLLSKRREEIVASGKDTEENLSKEYTFYNYNQKHNYDSQNDACKGLLDKCEIYMNWWKNK